jgi:hypothetical protein
VLQLRRLSANPAVSKSVKGYAEIFLKGIDEVQTRNVPDISLREAASRLGLAEGATEAQIRALRRERMKTIGIEPLADLPAFTLLIYQAQATASR